MCEARSPPPSLAVWMMRQLLDHWHPCRCLGPSWHSPRRQTPPPRMQGSGRHFRAHSLQSEVSCAAHCDEACAPESHTVLSNSAAASRTLSTAHQADCSARQLPADC